MNDNFMNADIRADMQAAHAKEMSWREWARLMLVNPDFKTVFYYRVYSRLHRKGNIHRGLAKLLYAHAVRVSSCYISPLALIGPGFRLMHATGVVIGTGVRIEPNVTVYQNVTLGQRRDTEDAYPYIKEGAVIYAGACVLGAITVGAGAVIGANAVVLADVPDGAAAAGMPAKILSSGVDKQKNHAR